MIATKDDGAQHLFLIDEVFRGTNTIERVAAAHAVLQYLDQGNDVVVVATHDIELVALLDDRFRSSHFREDLVDGRLHFEYCLKDGPSSTRNAIALLRLMQYPESVIDLALSSAERLERVSASRVASPIAG
jgi:DNA mismatch repair ATPase MutS